MAKRSSKTSTPEIVKEQVDQEALFKRIVTPKMAKSPTLDERKQSSLYIGEQELSDISFNYTFTYIGNRSIKNKSVSFSRDERLTSEEAWALGRQCGDELQMLLVNCYEEISAGRFLDKCDETPQGIPTSVPTNASPSPSA